MTRDPRSSDLDYPTTASAVPAPTADVVIIGGGAAGLTAAQVLGRARRTVTVVDGHAQRNAPAGHMHGYLSRDGMPPLELVATGREEATRYGVDFIDGHVTALEWRGTGSGFVLRLTDGRELTSRAVLVATGLRDELPALPGLEERWGVDVLHCPFCHAYEVRDQPLGVLGGANRELSVHQALLMPQWSRDVTFFPNGIELTPGERARIQARGVYIVDEPVRGIVVADDRLRAVELRSGQLVPRAALFVAPRFVPHAALLLQIGCDEGPGGLVATDETGGTTVPGVWAAGNVSDPRAQVITAAGQGSAAAIAINGYLLAHDVEAALAAAPQPAPFGREMEASITALLLNERRSGPGWSLQ
ncbi:MULTISPECIES: NAD(P)/FAD-dependent oxidoreductase [unclassified Mycolicibacterium]|uniref:NAD(P)/FAD-dependent oxidoreductase n=1 Tax=unclassified Mycolicibacterium TaxID=2636767 RepID=UPI0012DCD6AD|nr:MULTISPECIES: NAD(P)/FAD-dependent oxidoreductase [unclassified Mycolicibacterium]MUL80696.1 NAD(P)/FAD-dependent oxidoreductase [Mycolicibacterium sp. CBMA 329]MUL86463.1 NAD(P)/FAD-dependent oxidoreductase [Mycolicibacterium sp. CBMA 331]MUM01325.1 NAD(P)/FAD-dependent oxidoreductase [Mycolicibacterium sp. CBMA 334]MUM25835.1 NAD(P)/FAD-dependent oxidoreductase [Mycolicibacterium sp. CBMA 295]MUM36759.1 NAD(P)/FAD-dependent oxidoreductase [Mycolicibacterium sp. CBMA 247]